LGKKLKKNLKLDKLQLKANTLISEIEENTDSDINTLKIFNQKLTRINSDTNKEERRITEEKRIANDRIALEEFSDTIFE
jgi:hypothetical protein